MYSRIKITAVIIVTALAIGVFSTTLVRALWYAPDSEVAPPHAVAHAPTPTDPLRLRIPAISVDAKVQQVGVNGKGNMGVPNNFTDVAWYKYGTVPGQVGSAVIDGHVDNGLALAGVFKHLQDVKVGDDIYVDAKDGAVLHFVVREIQNYPYKEVPITKLFNRTDASRLNLITCGGEWVKGEKTYDHRLVVYTELVQ